jgi:hypothetical protein
MPGKCKDKFEFCVPRSISMALNNRLDLFRYSLFKDLDFHFLRPQINFA